MHELGITQNIVAIVAEHAKGRPVARVVLEVGALAGVMTDSILFCFDVVAQGTPLQGAALEISRIEARGRCRACGAEFARETLFSPCICGSRDVEGLSGEELRIKEYQLDLTPETAPEERSGRSRAETALPGSGERNV
jgi:hydrogenase nickel incorporation protein HypA/HybF